MGWEKKKEKTDRVIRRRTEPVPVQKGGGRERERERERERDRETERDRDRETERDREREKSSDNNLVVVAFSSLARILREGSTIHSLPAFLFIYLFMSKWRSAPVHQLHFFFFWQVSVHSCLAS